LVASKSSRERWIAFRVFWIIVLSYSISKARRAIRARACSCSGRISDLKTLRGIMVLRAMQAGAHVTLSHQRLQVEDRLVIPTFCAYSVANSNRGPFALFSSYIVR